MTDGLPVFQGLEGKPKGSTLALILCGAGSLVIALSSGCRIVQTAADIPGHAVRVVTPGKTGSGGVDPVELQQNLMRFANQYYTAIIIGVEGLRRDEKPLDPTEILLWKSSLANAVSSIVIGQNAVANVLDMTAFVTVTRLALEKEEGGRLGSSVVNMLAAARTAETNIWLIASRLLSPEEQARFRGFIVAYYEQNPVPETILAARAAGMASQVARSGSADSSGPGGILGLLNLDPLASLDPATRELAQARLFAERALYLAHRMPLHMRWQAELLTLKTLETPAVQQFVTNSAVLSASIERFTRVAEELPAQLRTEREEILKKLETQEGELTALSSDIRQTLEAGSRTADSLNTTLTALDAVLVRLKVGGTNEVSTADTNKEPFRIQDYATAAARLESASRELTTLLLAFDRTLASTNFTQLPGYVTPVLQEAQTGGKELADYVFWKGVILIVIALMATLVCRFVSQRVLAANRKKPVEQ